MALDQLHEQKNKYIKSVSGATSLINRQDDSALVRWELCEPELYRIIEKFEEVESSTTHEKNEKHHEDSPIFTKDFIKDNITLLNNFPNNPSYSMILPRSTTQIWYLKTTFIATCHNC